MGKQTTVFVCANCQATTQKWSGKCESCGEWNTLEERTQAVPVRGRGTTKGNSKRVNTQGGNLLSASTFADIQQADTERLSTHIPEVDRVLGGGIVPGMVMLLAGEPGIGKSTLLMQLCAALAKDERTVLYASGEESGAQVRMRAERLGVDVTCRTLSFAHEQDVTLLGAHIQAVKTNVLIIDSIQTAFTPEIDGEPGNVAQVRGAAAYITDIAKRANTAVVLVGHVTKGGNLAGPKTLEHIVDTVLQLEGDRSHAFRILKSVKNRFGATDETAMFEMEGEGLQVVPNPSAFFLAERQEGVPGSVVTAAVEGTGTFLVEVQAIATPTAFGYPKRAASGCDVNRLQLLIAVLQKAARLNVGERDVYANVIGGVQLREPSADLAFTLAIASSTLDRASVPGCVAIGEVGLTGEIRSVPHIERRVKEAVRMGCTTILVPAMAKLKYTSKRSTIHRVKTIREAIQVGLQPATQKQKQKHATRVAG